jgi:acyl phosphate:glycerol-3-phosphate acyltransferase
VAVIVVAYLLGSIPFGYLIVRASQGADVRETGSGGTGATNVSRRAGKLAGVITLVLDAMKGAAAVLIALWAFGILSNEAQAGPAVQNTYWWAAAAAVATIVGHIFPVWLRFRGGKGVATGVGVFLVLAPVAVALAGVIFVLVVVSTRHVSLGSILAAAAIPFFVLGQNEYLWPVAGLTPLLAAASASALLIIFAHRGNIERLVKGTESKFR